jgi:lipopolysaccharide transport system ATP-binding protein
MMMRLTFAIATSIDAEIIIMDEWLSVGDLNFRDKAAQRLTTVVNNAAILVIASHDKNMVEKTCTRRIVLEHGRIAADDPIISNP